MGMRNTALAPVRRVSQGSYLVKPKPSGALLIQSLIESIEGLKNTLALQTRQPGRFVSSAPAESTESQQVQVRQVQSSESRPKRLTVKKSRVPDFFD